MQRDPLEYVDGMNAGEYVVGRSTVAVDSNGGTVYIHTDQPDAESFVSAVAGCAGLNVKVEKPDDSGWARVTFAPSGGCGSRTLRDILIAADKSKHDIQVSVSRPPGGPGLNHTAMATPGSGGQPDRVWIPPALARGANCCREDGGMQSLTCEVDRLVTRQPGDGGPGTDDVPFEDGPSYRKSKEAYDETKRADDE